MAFSVSSASALVSATRSCESRDRPRSRRAIVISGRTITGIMSTMTPVSCGLVRASIVSAPAPFRIERSVMERFTPAMACTRVVSVVSRDSTSPVRVTSKKVGSMRMTRA